MEEKTGYKKPLQWHPAFFAGIQIELQEEGDKLTFENEHQLGTKPKEIDVLIIKKDKKAQIQKNIGRIFREHNIVEYKSPDDSLSIDDFYKVYGYACFYKSDSPTIDGIKIDDITISFFCSRYPKKLVRHLIRERGYQIIQSEKGIYYIEGDVFPVQLVLSPELTEEQNLWLKSLTNQIKDDKTIGKLVRDFQQHTNNIWYISMMNMIVRANMKKFQEVQDMSVCEALEELMHDELEECRKRGWMDGQKAGWIDGQKAGWRDGQKAGLETGRYNKEKEVISKMQKNGFSPEMISQILEIPLKDVLAVKQ